MPIKKTQGGYKFGKKGKLYKGRGAREKARRQGAAIKISQNKK